MSKPLVSIIIPCYNAGPWVAATLESALAQTWQNKEIIFINDGSDDASLEVAQRFETRGVQIVDQTNRGASAARNTGLRVARGDYIQFLDADDLLASDKIERQLEVLASARDYVASCAWGRFKDNPGEAVFNKEPVWADLTPVDWLVCSWSGGGMMHPAAWLTPRHVVEAAGPWNESLSLDDDGEYFCRIVLASAGVKFVATARTFYRSHYGSRLSASTGYKAALSSFTSCELKERHLLAVEDSPRTRRALASRYSHFAWEQLGVAPDLVSRAVARWQVLAPDLLPPAKGKITNAITKVLGWRTARHLQLQVSRLRSP